MDQEHNKENKNVTTSNSTTINGNNRPLHNLDEIHNSLVRIFSSQDGKKILNYWQSSILERSLGSDTNVNHMYYHAGERNFILKIKRILNNDK